MHYVICVCIYIYTLFFMSVCVCACMYVYIHGCVYIHMCVLYHQPLVSACGCNVIISTFALNPYKPQWEIAHKSQLAMCAISSLFAAGNGKAGLKCIFQCDKILSEGGSKKSICSYLPSISRYMSRISKRNFAKRYMSSRNHRCSSNFGGIPRSKSLWFSNNNS